MNSDYKKATELLTSKGRFRIELGLGRISSVLKLLGNPENDFKIIHVAGTNGKGSVCSITAKILECAGFKTALYTSPHLVEYTERIKINSEDISKEDFAKYISLVVKIADENSIELTEFEILTAAAFKYFSDKKVDYALIETGLGGRFDATNAAENKILSVITSISIDHKNILGSTTEKIAFEKAGILRTNIPVIISEKNKGFDVVKNQAEKLNSPILIPETKVEILFENGINYAFIDGKKFEFSLLGAFQRENLELVFEITKQLYINENSVRKALKTVQWHSRFQYIKDKNLLIDGAHNEDGAKVLRKSLDLYFKKQKRTFIYGSMNTKEYNKVAEILFRSEDTIYFYRFRDKRSISFEEFQKCCPSACEITSEDIKKLLKQISKDTITIACGSFYVTGEVLKLI